jgi:hypothetical protein
MIIKIKVKPNSDENKLQKLDKENYIARIKEEPKNNKANPTLIKLLKQQFSGEIKIKTGFRSRKKIVEVK